MDSEKVKENIRAAEFLNGNGFPNSSVHCSYYSVIQSILLFLFLLTGENYCDKRYNSRRNNDHKVRTGLHEYLIESYIKLLEKILIDQNKNGNLSVNDKKMLLNVKSNFTAIKSNRVAADYKGTLFSKDSSDDHIVKSKFILSNIEFYTKYI